MIKILNRPTLKRSENDLQQLVPYMRNIDFFREREIKIADMLDIMSCIQYERFSSEEVIMNWGELGEKFYILMEGQVSVLIPSPKKPGSRDNMQYVYDEIQELKLDLIDIDKMVDHENQKTLKTEASVEVKEKEQVMK